MPAWARVDSTVSPANRDKLVKVAYRFIVFLLFFLLTAPTKILSGWRRLLCFGLQSTQTAILADNILNSRNCNTGGLQENGVKQETQKDSRVLSGDPAVIVPKPIRPVILRP